MTEEKPHPLNFIPSDMLETMQRCAQLAIDHTWMGDPMHDRALALRHELNCELYERRFQATAGLAL